MILKTGFLIFAFFASLCNSVGFADVRFMAGGSYESLKIESEAYKGGILGATVQVDVFDSVPGFSPFVLLGIGLHTDEGQNSYTSKKYEHTQGELGLGLQIGVIPLVRISAEVAYSKNLGGTFSDKTIGSSPASGNLAKFDYVRIGGRVMLTVAPFMSLGVFGGIYSSGKVAIVDGPVRTLTGSYFGPAIALNF